MNLQMSYLTFDRNDDTLRGREGGAPAPAKPDRGVRKRHPSDLTSCRTCATMYADWLKHMNIQRGMFLRRLQKANGATLKPP